MRTVLFLVVGSFLSGLLGSYEAFADESRNLQAESLFVEGRRLMKAKRYAEACDKFESSQALDPAVGTLMNLADCNVRINRTASAWAQFREAAAIARGTGDRRRGGVAAQRAAALLPTLARLRVVTGALPAGVTFVIRVNERDLPVAAWNTAMPVDPGAQAVVVTGSGYTAWTTRAQAAGSSETTVVVSVPVKVAQVDAPTLEQAAASPALNASGAIAPPPHEERSYTSVWVAAGVTGTALVVGGVFGYLANDSWNTVSSECVQSGGCTTSERNAAKDARSAGTISTIAFASAGVAAIVTGVLWRRATRQEEDVKVSWWLDRSSAGAGFTGRF